MGDVGALNDSAAVFVPDLALSFEGSGSESNVLLETEPPQQRGDETVAQQYWFAEELLSQSHVRPAPLRSSSSGVASAARCDSSSGSGLPVASELRRLQGQGQRHVPHSGLPVVAAAQPMAFSIFADQQGGSSKEESIDSNAKRKQRIASHLQQDQDAFPPAGSVSSVTSDVPAKSNFTIQLPVPLSSIMVDSNRGEDVPMLSNLKEMEAVPASPQKRIRKEIAASMAAVTQQSLEPIDGDNRETAHNRSRRNR